MRVALYARVSTWDKDQNPETQLHQLRAWAAAHEHQVIGEYVDQASATDMRRRAAWADVMDQAALWDVLAVTKIERAWRSTVMMHHDLEDLDRRSKGFVATTQPFDTTGSYGRLGLNILAAFAEFERDMIRERTREGMARARAEGKPIGKRGPDKKPRQKKGGIRNRLRSRLERP